ncbi:hypothetical protein J4G07_07765 [Candidatus Poribacteria bacterium]|nr:hypothetical protein [Candidatus Poribacteria bacterium]
MQLLKNFIGFGLSLLILFAIGCQQDLKKNVTSLSSVDGVGVEEPYMGDLIIGDVDDKFANDSFAFNDATITGDMLTINVSYSGGCKNHQFTLVASDSFLESFPVQLRAYIIHNANRDTCEARPTEDYRFDLTPIKTLYQEAYRQKAGTIILRLKDAPERELIYEFAM